MKKTYSKPHVYVEKFELCEHISSCGKISGVGGYALHWEPDKCAFSAFGPDDNSIIVFRDPSIGCDPKLIDDMDNPNFLFGEYNGMDFTPDSAFSS